MGSPPEITVAQPVRDWCLTLTLGPIACLTWVTNCGGRIRSLPGGRIRGFGTRILREGWASDFAGAACEFGGGGFLIGVPKMAVCFEIAGWVFRDGRALVPGPVMRRFSDVFRLTVFGLCMPLRRAARSSNTRCVPKGTASFCSRCTESRSDRSRWPGAGDRSCC